MARLRPIALLLVISTSILALAGEKPLTNAADISAGPSMEEVTGWIKRKLPPMGTDHVVTSDGNRTYGKKYEIKRAVLADCRLTLDTAWQFDSMVSKMSITDTVTLKDIDLSKLQVREDFVGTGYTNSKPSYLVPLVAIQDRGQPFTSVSEGLGNPSKMKSLPRVAVRVRDQDMANQVATMLRRAAILCGAPDVPVAAVDTTPASGPAIPKAVGMTNVQVVDMVQAGLSSDVIAKAIQTAPGATFDVTPVGLIALKKAKVPDAVISAMQSYGGSAPSRAEASTKPTPKYDPSIVPKPKATPSPCEGVELLGLHKEDLRPMSPLILYFAKVRNGTSMTKIVSVEWTNLYGERIRNTAEVGAGQIATLQLAAQQPIERFPIDLRLGTCR